MRDGDVTKDGYVSWRWMLRNWRFLLAAYVEMIRGRLTNYRDYATLEEMEAEYDWRKPSHGQTPSAGTRAP